MFDLQGKCIAFTGKLASLSQTAAAELVRAAGGRYSQSVTRATDWLVVGQDGWPLQADGQLTGKLQLARRWQQRGRLLEILTEEEFCRRLQAADLEEQVCRLYTTGQVVQLLNVPTTQLRAWIRHGLLRPQKIVHRLQFFDFRQVTGIRTLWELTQAGVTQAQLRESLGNWRPDDDLVELLSRLTWYLSPGILAVRRSDGRLAEMDGQLLLSFGEESEAAESHLSTLPASRTDLFTQASAAEEAGDYGQAADLYRELLIQEGPAAEVCQNLGNALYASGELPAARERFQQALELDPSYVEAWNNLGTVQLELGATRTARSCFERALSLAPQYADARFNLARLLEEAGEPEEAAGHWQQYLQQDGHSVWADHARSCLAAYRASRRA